MANAASKRAGKLWYAQLKKPGWAPSSERMELIWSLLFPLILGSFGYVFWRTYKTYYPPATIVPFVATLVFAVAYWLSLSRLQSKLVLLVEVLAIDITLVSAVLVIWPYSLIVALAQTPFMIWMVYLTVLQVQITRLDAAASPKLSKRV